MDPDIERTRIALKAGIVYHRRRLLEYETLLAIIGSSDDDGVTSPVGGTVEAASAKGQSEPQMDGAAEVKEASRDSTTSRS